jgi:hypothetical protein
MTKKFILPKEQSKKWNKMQLNLSDTERKIAKLNEELKLQKEEMIKFVDQVSPDGEFKTDSAVVKVVRATPARFVDEAKLKAYCKAKKIAFGKFSETITTVKLNSVAEIEQKIKDADQVFSYKAQPEPKLVIKSTI